MEILSKLCSGGGVFEPKCNGPGNSLRGGGGGGELLVKMIPALDIVFVELFLNWKYELSFCIKY